MPETITEMIIPDVYIEVRAEGLIGAGGVSLANVGIVGTANRGPVGQVQMLSSAGELEAAFGTADAFTGAESDLSLARALDLLFANGARTVYAVRTAAPKDVKEAVYALKTVDGKVAVTLTANTPGTWGNDLGISLLKAAAPVLIKETVPASGAGALTLKRKPAADARTVVRVTKGSRTRTFLGAQVLTAGTGELKAEQVRINPEDRKLTFHADALPAAGDQIEVTYAVEEAMELTLELKGTKERFVVPDAAYLLELLQKNGSQFVTARLGTDAYGALRTVARTQDGANGEKATAADYEAALEVLANQNVHIVIAPGLSTADAYEKLNAHCQAAVDNGRERVAVVGTNLPAAGDAKYAQSVATQAMAMGSDRVIFVAPGIVVTDKASGQKVSLPGTYAAAAVAGLISKLSAHTSPTNKEVLGIAALERELTPAELKLLLNSRVMPLHTQAGFRVVRGLTTSPAPWSQVTTRRIVDYAKAGIRQGALPYIGRLNNDRVRKALKGTLDGFLTGMVQDEMLTSYQLDVKATRTDEINNRCTVTVTLKPTFSIDFVKVMMDLQ
ncbi:MAG TPA: phage tail sheath subtilisin-like domain-containing protein [Symbiobacteriaceae bacterium]|nr:phage tail sheath subtilisin-like domain-containing protein [Symbiobacteriaceae bacterium]